MRMYITPQSYGIGTHAMILAVGNTKGGVGKTMIALNLAILRAAAGRDVLLVDGDEQGSASLFSQLRADLVGACGYTAAGCTAPRCVPRSVSLPPSTPTSSSTWAGG